VSAAHEVSVVVVTFNGREFVPACLESIPAGAETIVVDNASSDGTADLVQERFPKASLLRNSVNRGFAAGVNRGIAASRGRYVCLLNPDAKLSPGTLSTLAAYLDAHPDVGAAAPQLLHEDGRRQNSFDNFPSFATVFLNKSLLRLFLPGRFPSKTQEWTEPRDVESVIGACMMIRRGLLDRIGGLDEAYFLFLEETDWCLRAWRAGSRIAFVPGATAVHLQGGSRDTVRFRARIEYVRSLFTFFRKHRSSSPLVRALYPFKSLLEVIFGVFGLAASRGRRRWVETVAVLGWQILGCPRGFGLSMAAEPRYLTLRDNARVLEEHMEAFNEFENKTKQQKLIKNLKHKKTVEYSAAGRTYLVKMYKLETIGRKIRALLAGSKAGHEFEVSLELQRRGIPAVRVVAVKESGDPRWVACEKLEGWDQLQAVLLSDQTPAGFRRRLCFQYGMFARRLQDAGVWQYDFNPSNVLVRDRELTLIDFERVEIRPRALNEGDRFYLLAKMNRLPKLSRTDRMRFLTGYLAAHSDEGGRLGSIAAEIARRTKLQETADSERVEERCVSENRDYAPFEFGDSTGHYLRVRPERPVVGVTLDELRAMIDGPGGQPAEDALEEWKRANRRAREGAAPPVAVIVKKGERKGRIIFRT